MKTIQLLRLISIINSLLIIPACSAQNLSESLLEDCLLYTSLVVLAKKRQSLEIFRLVKRIDPNAFISQSSVIGVYREGFDKLKVK